MSRPSYFEPYQVPPGYFDEEILTLEGVRNGANAHYNPDLMLVAYDAIKYVLEITAGKGTRETFISLIDLCKLARTSWPKDQLVTDTFEKLAERVRAGLQANERAGGRK